MQGGFAPHACLFPAWFESKESEPATCKEGMSAKQLEVSGMWIVQENTGLPHLLSRRLNSSDDNATQTGDRARGVLTAQHPSLDG